MEMLMSIQPRHWRAIRDGHKTLELRRVRPREKPDRIFFYVTAPYHRVMGVADCVRVASVFNRGGFANWRKRGDGMGWREPNKREARWLRDACVTFPEAMLYLARAKAPTGFWLANYEPIVGAHLHELGFNYVPQSWAWIKDEENER